MDWILEPIIGAVIGCFTNFIAIKMLFHPYNKICFLGITLPFTPGLVPKRKPEIAKAIGRVVNDHLLGKEEILQAITKDEIIEKINELIMDYHVNIPKHDEDEESLGDMLGGIVANMDIAGEAAEEIAKFIRKKTEGNFFAKFISDKMIQDLSEQLGEWIQTFMDNEGKALVAKTIDKEIDDLADMRVYDILLKYNINIEKVKAAIEKEYKDFIGRSYDKLFAEMDIAGIVEGKICAMNMAELERLLLQVMKKELNAIVYLGAVIGFVIGLINVFI